MERLSISGTSLYAPLEAAIHLGRYAPLLPYCSGKRVLDVACGEGYGSWLLSQAGALSVHGVDRSVEAINAANRWFQAPNLCFDVCDAGNLEDRFESMRFNVITCIETIEHIAEPRAFLRQIRRIAAPDCLILITCPNDHWYYGPDQGNPYHVEKYTFAEFQAMTTAELGHQVQWFAGTAAQGFAMVPISASGTQTIPSAPSRYVAVDHLASAVICPPDESDPVDVTVCSYFVGVWNHPDAPIAGGALFPMSMTTYALREQASALRERLAACDIENGTLQGRLDAIARDYAKLEQDARAYRVQSATLRRENDVLAESVSRWRAEASQAREAYMRLQEGCESLQSDHDRLQTDYDHLQTDHDRLEAELAAMREVLTLWTARKQRLARLVPAGLQPIASRLYRRVIART